MNGLSKASLVFSRIDYDYCFVNISVLHERRYFLRILAFAQIISG
jgi:hypothetical protein